MRAIAQVSRHNCSRRYRRLNLLLGSGMMAQCYHNAGLPGPDDEFQRAGQFRGQGNQANTPARRRL